MRAVAAFLLRVTVLATATMDALGQAPASTTAGLPKVALVGDSIRLGYAPRVKARLEGKAVFVSPPRTAATAPACSPTSTSGSSPRSPTSCT
jgi:hypothetical protein